ncbi:MAG: ChaN family lipoprotein [Nitrospirae bacterium]|nr:ChaN family lipoprotein [Nitrospirota bacterium]
MIRMTTLFIVFLIILGTGCAVHSPVNDRQAFSVSPYRPLDTLTEGTILHLPTGIEVTKEQMFQILSGARVVYVGETHTNVKDHQVELEILKGLSERFPGRVAVGMEMFQRPSQKQLDRWSRGELDEKAFMDEWHANWDQSYTYYRDILRYVRDRKIPLVALNASERLVRAVMEKGTNGLPEDLKKELPEMDRNDTYHRDSLEAVFGGHAHGKEGFERFYQTMLIWDETMAQTAATYLAGPEGQGRKMVVFTGGFHVNYGFGVPRRAFKRLPEPYAIVMPYTAKLPENRTELIMDVKPVSIPLYLADFVWAVGYEDLEDRIVHLGVQIDGTEKGVAVRKVMPRSTASKIGILEGDIIVSFDGQPIMRPFDLTHLMSLKQAGDRADLRIRRGEQTIDLEAQFELENKTQ